VNGLRIARFAAPISAFAWFSTWNNEAPPFLKEIDISGYLMTMPAMTHEERAIWIRRVFILLLSVGVVAGVWFYRKTEPPPPPPPAVASADYDLEIIHYHDPESPQSVEIAKSLNEIGEKYAMQVLVTRVDIRANPLVAKTRGVGSAPRVSMMTGETEAFAFEGLRPRDQIERKVEEILRGLKRVGKDWRPEVKGMQPMSKPTPLAPVKHTPP
jgi:hypothetical protein